MLVVATKPFEYQGCPVVPDDVCLVQPVEAAALVYQQQARWPSDDDALFGVYQRRDMTDPAEPRRRRSRRREPVMA
jgi:hypothetical protein